MKAPDAIPAICTKASGHAVASSTAKNIIPIPPEAGPFTGLVGLISEVLNVLDEFLSASFALIFELFNPADEHLYFDVMNSILKSHRFFQGVGLFGGLSLYAGHTETDSSSQP
jgi:hypothetical protein